MANENNENNEENFPGITGRKVIVDTYGEKTTKIRLEPSKEELLDYIKWLENHISDSIWKVGTADLDKGYYKDWIQNIELEENEEIENEISKRWKKYIVMFDFQGSATEYWWK